MRRIRRYGGRLSATIWYGVQEGHGGANSLLMPLLRLAYICRRRMMRTLAMDGLGTVAVVEEVDLWGESGGIELDSPPPYGMVCRKAMVAQIACSCHFYDCHTYVDDE